MVTPTAPDRQPPSPAARAGGPLRNLRVVEFRGIGPGPFATMLLSDMGADVVRIDRIGGSTGDVREITARGRRAVELDLKSAEGARAALDLIAEADILIEGFRPGVMERLGLGPDVALARNPRLIYGRMTGWGQAGPLASAAGHDINYIAITGALDAIGPRDAKPVPPLNLVGDYGGGALYLVTGVLAAVIEARQSGQGQVVDAAMCDGAASLMSYFFELAAQGIWTVGQRGANFLDGGAPYYDTYLCADGRSIAVGPIEHPFYEKLCTLAGLDDAVFALRDDRTRWPQVKHALAEVFRTRSRDEWCTLFEGTDACVAPVLSMAEAPAHPHLAARNSFAEVAGVRQPAPAPRFSRTPSAIQGPPPTVPVDVAGVLNSWRAKG